MIINSIPGANIASAVWATAVKVITGLGTALNPIDNNTGSTISPATSLDLRPAVGKFRDLIIFVVAGGSNNNSQIGIFDGAANLRVFATIAVSTSGGQISVIGTNKVGPGIKNNDTISNASAFYGGAEWST